MTRTATVVACDDFGLRLSRTLTTLVPGTTVAPPDAALPGDGAVVLASSRPEPAAARRLTAVLAALGRSFVPVWVDQPQLVIGPLAVPGVSACWVCYERRTTQHDPAAATTRVLHAAYDADPALRPGGWLPSVADTAAAVVAATLLDRPDGLRPGQVRLLDTLSLLPSSGEVTGFTGCPVCDPEDTAARSWAGLHAAWPALVGAGRDQSGGVR